MIAASWQMAEDLLSLIFSHTLGGQEKAAQEIFNVLIDRNLKKDALLAVAKNRLSPALQGRISVAYERGRKLAKKRNEVIHASWAIIDKRPQSLMSYEPGYQAIRKSMALNSEIDDYRDSWNFTEYTEKDLDTTLAMFANFRNEVHDLLSASIFEIIGPDLKHPWLSGLHRIAMYSDKPPAARQTSPKPQPSRLPKYRPPSK